MNNFWSGFEKQADILSSARNVLATGIKGVRSLGSKAITQGAVMAGKGGAQGAVGKGLSAVGNFARSNPRTAMGIAGGAALGGATALSGSNKQGA